MNGEHVLPADFRGIIEECATRAMDEDVEGIPEWDRFRVVSDDVGKFLYILARATGRKKIVELDGQGGAGSSVVWLSAAMDSDGGEIIATETNPRRWVKLQNSLSRARLSPKVQLRTLDPIWDSPDGNVIAPPVGENPVGLVEEPMDCCDMAVVSLTESDWPERIRLAWDLLKPFDLMVLLDTLQVGDYAETILGDFFGTRNATATGIRLGEGIIVAVKLGDRIDTANIPEIEMVGETAHEVLRELERENRKPDSRLLAIPPVTGQFLWMVLRAMKAKNVLEIGTSSGYSGVWITSALKHSGGRLTTMDVDPEKISMAADMFTRAGVSDMVNLMEGDALELVPTLERQYDMIFLDCEKEIYYDLLESVLHRIRRGGLLIADNVISHQIELGAYLDEVKRHSSLMSVTLPIGSGEEMTMVL